MMRFEPRRTAGDVRPDRSGACGNGGSRDDEREVQVQVAVDACPGMLTLHPARDGDVARIRLPGGYVTSWHWSAIAALARAFGDGNVDVTARGNVQVRGLRPGAAGALASRAAEAGLLPSGAAGPAAIAAAIAASLDAEALLHLIEAGPSRSLPAVRARI